MRTEWLYKQRWVDLLCDIPLLSFAYTVTNSTKMTVISKGDTVLVTGASGFIAV